MEENHTPVPCKRRDFLRQAGCVCLGGAGVLAPVAAGVTFFLDPLRREAEAGKFIQVASLAALPEDGSPRKFAVITHRHDAWNKFPDVPVGAVYLRRLGAGAQAVQALNVACPHAGCFVDFKPERQSYLCPCHNSSFGLDGRIIDAHSPAPRGLDELAVQVRNGSEVWVKFQNYVAGIHERQPLT